MQIPTPTSGDLSLYIHLPFCQKKCDYCHFFVLPNKEEYHKQLLHALLKEIELKRSWFTTRRIISLYFGGGTPSLVSVERLHKLIEKLLGPKIDPSIEITLEVNPENSSISLFQAYRQIGINRLSIGAQSLDDLLLKRLSRTHNSKQVLQCIEQAHQAGFENLSIDLMYDLPTQTLQSWKQTVDLAAQLPISHLSLYNLSIEKHTVFFKKREEIQKLLPKEQASLDMFLYAHQVFSSHLLAPYEISAFCKPKFYSKHNTGYWLQRDHLGLGPSAFSLMNKRRFQNISHLKKYSQLIEEEKIPISFEETLSNEHFLKESLALNLRLIQGVHLPSFEKRWGRLSSQTQQTLRELEKQGLVIWDKEVIKLSNQGLLHHDAIAAEII